MSAPEMITIYDEVTGEALYSCHKPAQPLEPGMIGAGRAIFDGKVDGATHWINPETKRANLRRDPGARIAKNRLTGIPEGARVMVAGTPVAPEDGEVRIAVDYPEAIEVEIDGPRLKHKVVKVDCAPDGLATGATPSITISQDWKALRLKAYREAGLTAEAIAAAQLDADPTELAQIQATRATIKSKFPKRG